MVNGQSKNPNFNHYDWKTISVFLYTLQCFRLFYGDITSSYWIYFLSISQGQIHMKRPLPTFSVSLKIWISGKIPRRSTLTSHAPPTPRTCNLSLTQWPMSSSRTTWRTADSSRSWPVSGENQLPKCHVCHDGHTVHVYMLNNQCSYCAWSHILAWNKHYRKNVCLKVRCVVDSLFW